MTTLLLSSRATEDNQALWRAAIARDWEVVRVRGIRVPEIDDRDIVLYIESLYAPTLAEALGLRLLEPTADWLPTLDKSYTRRDIRLATMGEARRSTAPAFVKPPNDKSFTAQVFASGADLPEEYDDAMPVLISDPVTWDVEFRCFALDGQVRTLSPYLRGDRLCREDGFMATDDELASARSLAECVLGDAAIETPRAVVIDVGRLADGEWAVVEANAAWGSGIYGCDPSKVLDVVREALVALGG